ncbi:MAG: ISKra4 family transposase [Pseudomonadota bacterium]
MQWRVTLEAIDPTGDNYRGEFSFGKDIGRLQDGEVGCSLEDGKTIMAEIQRIVVQREIDLYLEFRRICQDCHSRRWVKDRRTRKIETVFGIVEVQSPRYRICQKCHPYTDFTSTPVSEIVPNRATPELMRLSAKLGALMPYRQAADVLSTFLPDQTGKRFTTLRNRTLKVGQSIQDADFDRWWHELREKKHHEPQNELPLANDLNREIVLSIDTAFVPRTKRNGGRTFEAVVCHTSRGGPGQPAGPVFAFAGTDRWKLKAYACKALHDQEYNGHGEITVISDGEACLKNLTNDLPRKARHILDWFHIAMKVEPLAQLSRTAPPDFQTFGADIASMKWRLWHGQVDRALDLMQGVLAGVQTNDGGTLCLWRRRAEPLLSRLLAYIRNNQSSIPNYAKRYQAGKRISTTSAEAGVNAVVAKRFVKKQQMRWAPQSADSLLAVRAAVLNDELKERMSYTPPSRGSRDISTWEYQPHLPLAFAA